MRNEFHGWRWEMGEKNLVKGVCMRETIELYVEDSGFFRVSGLLMDCC
jgi:hypothetical protein